MPRVAILFALSIALAGCGPPKLRGRLAAPGARPLERPLRAPWPAQRQRACAERPRTGALHGAPYVQWVADDRATVLWRSSHGSEQLRVTTPGGAPVARRHGARAHAAAPWRATAAFLRPGATYCYSIERDGEVVSGPFALRAAPPPSSDEPVHLLALGDSGTAWPEQRAVAEAMRAVPSDLIVHTGDVAYDVPASDRYAATVFDVYRPLLRSVPMYPSIGNHDLEIEHGRAFDRAFHVPSSPPGRAYSFDWGPVHLVALDTTADLRAQARWLDRDLRGAQRPWRVVYMHHPPYSSGSHHGSNHDVRRWLTPVFRRHGVQLVLSGHDHHYERTRPIDGTTYVVTGGGGRELRPPRRSAWTEYAAAVHHFVHLRVTRDRIALESIDARGQVFDEATLVR